MASLFLLPTCHCERAVGRFERAWQSRRVHLPSDKIASLAEAWLMPARNDIVGNKKSPVKFTGLFLF